MNTISISGRLPKDPERGMTKTGTLVGRFTLAVSGRKDKTGMASTMWVDVISFSYSAEFALKYFKKGDLVGVEGSLQHETYTAKDGSNKSRFFIVANRVELLKQSTGERNTVVKTEDDDLPGVNEAPEAYVNPQAKALEIDDDDMPF